MRNAPHLLDMLALQVPNLLPKTIFGSHFPRRAGRLIWATTFFVIGCAIAYAWMKRPKKSAEPATWAATTVGAMFVWIMLTLGYGVIPSEWIVFGNSYLNFDSASFLLHKNSIVPFDITRDKFVDAVAGGIYIVVLVINVYFFAQWQKRKVREPATEAVEGEETAAQPPTTGGVFGRFRREKRVSAYGRPVTSPE